MPPPAFTLSVPADDPYKGLATEALGSYFRATGHAGSPAVDAFLASVAGAVGRIAEGGDDVTMVVTAHPGRVDVRLSGGHAAETLSHPAPVVSG